MVKDPFLFSSIPKIIFGPGVYKNISEQIVQFGKNLLLVTGGSSLKKSGKLELLFELLKNKSLFFSHLNVDKEPTPELIDEAVQQHRDRNIDVVLSIGGGSVIDTGKAISAMLLNNDSVIEYLEGVGSGKVHNGRKVPFIAVPTTSGTGSEATKNSVLSRIGANGFKKSIRHDNFIPDIAIIDPELVVSCPANITAYSGMDAFTQLLGSYVSKNSSPITDALAISGLKALSKCLVPACTTEPDNITMRGGMAYAALVSGITLSNAGLGIVHGLASAIGGYFEIPHGIICGTLVAEAVKMNLKLLRERGDKRYLIKYADVGSICSEQNDLNIENSCDSLIVTIEKWQDILRIPLLSEFGIKNDDVYKIVKKSSNKNNPIELSEDQIGRLILSRL